MDRTMCVLVLLFAVAIDHIRCSEHSHGANGTIKVGTISDMADGGKHEWIEDAVIYSFFGFVCLVIVFHLYLKRQIKKQLEKSEEDNRYKFEWE